MVSGPLQSLFRLRQLAKLFHPYYSNFTTLSPLESRIRSTIKLCKRFEDLKPLDSLLIVTGLIDLKLVITEFIQRCFDLGSPELALSTFCGSRNRSLLLQNLLIKRLSNLGLYQDVIFVYQTCRLSGCPGGDYTFPYVIKACSAMRDPNVSTLAIIVPVCTRLGLLHLSESLHGYAVKCGFNRDELLTPALISMHANGGDICAAKHLFEFSLTKNVIVWNSMIYAYTQSQSRERAFEMFSDMICADLRPNIATFVSVIPCCEKMNSICHGECLHGHAVKYGLDKQVSVATALISMYAKLGDIDSAIHIFTWMPQKNQLTWNSIISGYVHNGLLQTSLDAVCEMQLAGFRPDSVSIINVLSACSEKESFFLGKSAHAISIRKGFDSNINVSNLLLAFYSNCSQVHSSRKLFDRMANKNTISWNTMISGCVYDGQMEKATALLWKMQQEGVQLDIVTLVGILPGYNHPRDLLQGMALHGYALRFGWTSDGTLTNALISMYCNSADTDSATVLFHGLKEKSLISWNSLITGYRCHKSQNEVMLLFRQLVDDDRRPNYITLLNVLPACCKLLHGKSIHAYAIRTGAVQQTPLLTSLISMYSKYKNVASCLSVFRAGGKWNISLWNSMMSALIEAREAQRAFAFFGELLQTELEVDHITILSLVSACIPIDSMSVTNSVLAFVIKAGFFSDTTISNALVDLCAKCGDISMARSVFDTMVKKDAVSWSVMINGYGLHGDGDAAIFLLTQMENSGIQPDAITYLSVLSACSHAGLTEESKTIFSSMLFHGIQPTMEHYACILDLLGRTGQLHEAYAIVQRFPGGPSASMLESLLGACRVHGNAKLGGKIGELLIEMDPENSEVYVMLHNIYADAGRWHEANKIRIEMEERKLKKMPGFSLLEGRTYK
ncbi:hypothetical protein Cgig2_008022 [Carnegiea gigantea]|uniref:Pentatricopeptide repeat-containing protein n=1 Tax=Carnegiea gigantea TaxID=171969 RepID=A0A9Q1L269_9CARY|nr:hypothetical protein Cgig2_008022 [Carnegiea gigantea]